MTLSLRQIIIIVSTVLLFGKSYAQDPASNNFFNEMRSYNLSEVLLADSILAEDREGGKDLIKRAEILGFIGADYQRFFIHFVSVIQNPKNPYEYLVYGKTKVKETIRSFQGTITIKQANIHGSADIPTYNRGLASCEVILYEDKKQSATGSVKGKLKSNFLIDNNGQLRYDAIMFDSDGFSNNQFVGQWTSYKTNASEKCHWGDYRIPDCADLDIGAGEFSVNDKYLKNGWDNYRIAWIPSPQTSEVKSASQKEIKEWWK